LEAFVQLHPDLKEELDILSQFRVEPDMQTSFSNKEALFRHEELASINNENYESWLLMYVDHELNADQKKIVEAFTAENAFAARELAQLLKAILLPEAISFDGKQNLYRRPVRRIAPVWYRVAAAVLILAIGLGFFLLRRNNISHPTLPVAKTE